MFLSNVKRTFLVFEGLFSQIHVVHCSERMDGQMGGRGTSGGVDIQFMVLLLVTSTGSLLLGTHDYQT